MPIWKFGRRARKGIKNHQRVRVHLGAAERLGKIVILGAAEKIEPKQSAYCQVTLTEPLLALRGDHFIVRDETARRTLAGGVVINPWAKRHKRGERELQDRLEALHQRRPGGAHRKPLSTAAKRSLCRSTRFINFSTCAKNRCATPSTR